MTVKVFTIEQANRILPVVEEGVRLLREKVIAIAAVQDRMAVLSLIGADTPTSPEHGEMEEIGGELDDLLSAYNARLQELTKIGCVVKDLNQGLVDFYTRNGNDLVFLCWKLGEKSISYWHDLQGGFAGRRSISEMEEGYED